MGSGYLKSMCSKAKGKKIMNERGMKKKTWINKKMSKHYKIDTLKYTEYLERRKEFWRANKYAGSKQICAKRREMFLKSCGGMESATPLKRES